MANAVRTADGDDAGDRLLRAEITRTVDALLSRHSDLSALVLERIREEISRYGSTQNPEFLDDVLSHVDAHVLTFLSVARAGRMPNDEELEFAREAAARRARQLIPLDGILRALSIGHRVVWDGIVREAAQSPLGKSAALALASPAMRYIDVMSAVIAETYLREQQRAVADTDRARRDLLETVLEGRLPLADADRAGATAAGLDVRGRCLVVAARVREANAGMGQRAHQHLSEAIEHHGRAAGHGALAVARRDEVVGVIGADDSNGEGVCKRLERAQMSLARDKGIRTALGVSTVCEGFTEIRRGYEEAHRALSWAPEDGGLVALPNMSVFDYLVSNADSTTDRMIPETARRLIEDDPTVGAVAVETLRAYVGANLNMKRAAEWLTVHPNTVRYRLGRISEITGCDLREFDDLVELLTVVRVHERMSSRGRPDADST